MESRIKDYSDFLNEAKKETFDEFATNRLGGATAIAEAAKKKGGDAMLTYHHFRVKLPYYKKASEGKFDLNEAKKTLKQKTRELNNRVASTIRMEQIEFQKLVGEIEVLGELIINYNQK
jgi:hypothetical protein